MILELIIAVTMVAVALVFLFSSCISTRDRE